MRSAFAAAFGKRTGSKFSASVKTTEAMREIRRKLDMTTLPKYQFAKAESGGSCPLEKDEYGCPRGRLFSFSPEVRFIFGGCFGD